jgi:hypothetical protein
MNVTFISKEGHRERDNLPLADQRRRLIICECVSLSG